ncbi:Hypothetical predicted protein [Marmota monax]|uniref:Nanos-type domain-containing protein n=1 Tax=Marmota monax TaxID=9995 RepID=A0A5E4DBG8_MARMO|nr:Hypothetical predicted protein [Marmota monax]VTJ90542.1 Hypothetical predicted protein [Marmota monax]
MSRGPGPLPGDRAGATRAGAMRMPRRKWSAGGALHRAEPVRRRAAKVLLGCVPAAATPPPQVTPREERAPAWATEPRLQATSGTAAAWLLKPELQVCVFCGNNKEAVALYTTHILKGPDGRVLCPVLRRYTCPL